jgi:RNA polymerase sigma-70 factor (ECF subfamily)
MVTSDPVAAFKEAVREHAGLATRIVSGYEARRDLADELVQDVFAALWRALPSWRGEATIRTLVARIAHNIAVSHVRRAVRSRTEPLDADAGDDAALDAGDRAVERGRLLTAVRALPLPLRQAVILHLEGLSDDEAGSALGISTGAVAVRLTRARAALRAALAPQIETGKDRP